MALPPLRIRNGQFERAGRRFLLFGPVYFARQPGTCGGDYFADEWWPQAAAHLERDFSRMAEIGCNWVAPFVKTQPFFRRGRPVERVWRRYDQMVATAERCGLYLMPFPNHDMKRGFADLMGHPFREGPGQPHLHPSTNDQIYEATLKLNAAFAARTAGSTTVPMIMVRGGGRLWTGYAGYGPGEPEGRELLTVRKDWQAWLQRRYGDDFEAFRTSHPKLRENPHGWAEVALPVEVEGQFTDDDSRTFDFLAFTAELSAANQRRIQEDGRRLVPGSRYMFPFEGCEFDRGPMECYLPGRADLDAVWVEMYQFGMTHSSHTHPDWERSHHFEPTTGKLSVDQLSSITAAWKRARYLKAAAPATALVCCHGTVMDNPMRWTPEPRDQRILFERLQRTYLDAGSDGFAFWCWTDDESSSRPEPEYFYREGEAMGMVDVAGAWRPVARRAAAYHRCGVRTARVSAEALLLIPTPHLMGLDRLDALTTTACLIGALARLGVAPEVKATYFRGRGPIPLSELTPFKLVVLGADEYRKDLPEVPGVLRRYVQQGGRLVLAMGQADTLLSPSLDPLANRDLAALYGHPKLLATNHQHHTFWMQSLRWRLGDGFLPYWDRRRGRWMPGRGEKRLTFKWLQLGKGCEALAEAVAPRPPPSKDSFYGTTEFQYAGENVWYPLFYRRRLGKGAVYVFAYSLNVFRSFLDEIDVQRDDWDWVLEAAVAEAGVATDPGHSLSVLAQEFLNFRPTR
ncbi:MAG: hypothetical protein BWZ02_01023 [Lentisphaerae bacterium ADurb.BinA184]|nr:MAG: hypothetical protein BWZ02_01023 [Lentisphaerae bacterium ADurb.BinA184]